MTSKHTISDVSRIAGIPRDLLRMWERRYGYPKPDRDSKGDRTYSNEQLNKLVLVRQLVDQGLRPGKLMTQDQAALEDLLQVPRIDFDADELIDLLKARDVVALRSWLENQMQARGLRSFVHKVLAPAIQAVGKAWASGNLAIHEEHLFTELVENRVRQALIETRQGGEGGPRIMLTTVQGEQHSLGLLMVEALVRLAHAEVITFGTEMPFKDIREAAESHNVDIIGLSFSGHYKTDEAAVLLAGFRQLVDPGIRIWVGGAAFDNEVLMPNGVELIDGLYGLERMLAQFQQTYPVN